MPKMVALYNPGPREIDNFEVAGVKVTLLERQQKEYEEIVANRILEFFDFLEVREGSNVEGVEPKDIAAVLLQDDEYEEGNEERPGGLEENEEQLGEFVADPKDKASNSALCAVCGKGFQSQRGYRVHLKKAHNA